MSAPAPGPWTSARLVDKQIEGPFTRLRLAVADRVDHLPGQHYVVRLRAPDDYTAQRSYSVACEPADPLLELMVERFVDGEVSGHLHDVAEVGDVLEVRGPIGGWFVWDGAPSAIAVGGGTGVVPLVAMLRHARRIGAPQRLRMIAVARTLATLPYADELVSAGAFVALTRENRQTRVAAPPYVEEIRDLVEGAERGYVCGSAGFASFGTRLLGEAGLRAGEIRVEQFGVTGD